MYLNTETGDYPLTAQQVRERFPNVTFAAADFPPAPYVAVQDTARPAFDALTQDVVEGAPVLLAGAWTQVWSVVDVAPEVAQGRRDAAAAALQSSIVAAAQQRLDAFAKTRGYDHILSACTYATSTVPAFQTEGQYCVNARDATWSKLYEILGAVQAGTRPMPANYAEIEPELPALEWPL